MSGTVCRKGLEPVSVERQDPGLFYCDVVKCARCGGDHVHILFRKLKNPVQEMTHFAMCPVNQEPILLTQFVSVPADQK